MCNTAPLARRGEEAVHRSGSLRSLAVARQALAHLVAIDRVTSSVALARRSEASADRQ